MGLVLGSLVIGLLRDPNIGLVQYFLRLSKNLYPFDRVHSAVDPNRKIVGPSQSLSSDQPNVLAFQIVGHRVLLSHLPE